MKAARHDALRAVSPEFHRGVLFAAEAAQITVEGLVEAALGIAYVSRGFDTTGVGLFVAHNSAHFEKLRDLWPAQCRWCPSMEVLVRCSSCTEYGCAACIEGGKDADVQVIRAPDGVITHRVVKRCNHWGGRQLLREAVRAAAEGL